MPLPALAAAALPVIGNAINQIGSVKRAKKMMDYQNTINMQNYDRQRADMLSDWNMQNEFNSPEAQMARLKAAGLNPNMVYGNGGGLTTAQSPKTPDAPNVSLMSPQNMDLGIGGMLDSYQNFEIKQANIDNLRQQHRNMLTIEALNTIKTVNEALKGDTMEFDLSQKKSLAGATYETALATLDKLYAEIGNLDMRTETGYEANDRANELQPGKMRLQLADELLKKSITAKNYEEIERIKSAVLYLNTNRAVLEFEKEARANGWSFRDPLYQRQLMRVITDDKVRNTVKQHIFGDIDGKTYRIPPENSRTLNRPGAN